MNCTTNNCNASVPIYGASTYPEYTVQVGSLLPLNQYLIPKEQQLTLYVSANITDL